MAKTIVWSKIAQERRFEILDFWVNKTKSTDYSIKLNDLFERATSLIAEFPSIGIDTDDKSAKMKLVANNYLVYEETIDQIIILTIKGTSQENMSLRS